MRCSRLDQEVARENTCSCPDSSSQAASRSPLGLNASAATCARPPACLHGDTQPSVRAAVRLHAALQTAAGGGCLQRQAPHRPARSDSHLSVQVALPACSQRCVGCEAWPKVQGRSSISAAMPARRIA